MLAASSSAPNSPRPTPKPTNWRGVTAGLAEAKRLFLAGDLDQAEAHLREVLEFAPAEAKAWAWLGKVLLDKGLEGEAEECLSRARQLLAKQNSATDKPAASATLARLLWQQGDRKTARSMLAVLLMQRPDDAELHELKAKWESEASQ
ncbi:MAG TPA: tetratricopeptide repeat protein [Mariprofundaceae bacterium]|nr:tetratricopeptide repeat protein [Mariprofundaceae bacterium]